MFSKFKNPYNNVKNLLNLGLHLNNQSKIRFTKQPTFLRARNPALLGNPVEFLQQTKVFLKTLKRLLENQEIIAIVNTHPEYTGYAEFFEGSSIICYEEPWQPGTISNPNLGKPIPSLILLVSAGRTDLHRVLAEIGTTSIPVIHLNNYPVQHVLLEMQAFPNKNQVHFYLQLCYYLVLNQTKKRYFPIFPQEISQEVKLKITSKQKQQIDAENENLEVTLFENWKKKKEFLHLPKWISK